MKIVELSKLNARKTCLHFTRAENIPSISQTGLQAVIGENAKGIEKTAKIFFAMGYANALKICDTWIKWFIFTNERQKYFNSIKNLKRDQSAFGTYEEIALQFRKAYIAGKLFTRENKQEAYERFYEMALTNNYLILDLKVGVDYSMDDVDEVKIGGMPADLMKVMYATVTKKKGAPHCMEPWNMHTLPGKNIDKNQISMLAINGRTDMLAILQEFYKIKPKNLNLPFLNEFMEFANIKQQTTTKD